MRFNSFTEENKLEQLNTGLSKLSHSDNMEGTIVELTNIPAGDFSMPHGLKNVPKYRIILRQIGGGFITDQEKDWTGNTVYLNNASGTISRLVMYLE